MSFSAEDKYLADYLLGRLSEAERQALTELFLEDDEVYRATLATEEALIDAYARGDLPADEARLVELRLLATDAGKAKLRTARALIGKRALEGSRRRWKWVGIAAAVLLLVAGGTVGVLYMRPGAPLPVAGSPAAAIVIPLGATRGGEQVPSVSLPDSAYVAFALPVAEGDRATRYEARLRAPDGGEVVRGGYERRTADGITVEFTLERGWLAPGRYEVELTGIGGDGRRLIAYGPFDIKP